MHVLRSCCKADRAALYETVATELGLMIDDVKLQAMKEKNAAELKGLDEKYVTQHLSTLIRVLYQHVRWRDVSVIENDTGLRTQRTTWARLKCARHT